MRRKLPFLKLLFDHLSQLIQSKYYKLITLAASKNDTTLDVEIIAMNDKGQHYDYPDIVKLTISDHIKDEYIVAADYINNSGTDLCLFQHEYGIYGGNSGLLILSLLRRIIIPVVSTFHTIQS